MENMILAGQIVHELERARKKFPDNDVNYAALLEEIGELATALFSESRARVEEEAIQVAAMAMRIILDGDDSFSTIRTKKGLDSLSRSKTVSNNFMDLLDDEIAKIEKDIHHAESYGGPELLSTDANRKSLSTLIRFKEKVQNSS